MSLTCGVMSSCRLWPKKIPLSQQFLLGGGGVGGRLIGELENLLNSHLEVDPR